MKYKYKGKTAKAEFDKFDNAFSFLNKIRDGKISLTDAKKDKKRFWKRSGRNKKRKTLIKLKEQKRALHNINLLNKANLMVSEANIKAAKWTGLKILTPKQLLQRLLIVLAQAKVYFRNKLIQKLIQKVY